MGAVGENRRDENTFLIESEGIDTTVNGQTIKAFWQDVGVIAVNRFLSENELAKSAFEVRMPGYALESPYSIKNGMEIIGTDLNWRGVIRNITAERNDNVIIQMNVLVVNTTE